MDAEHRSTWIANFNEFLSNYLYDNVSRMKVSEKDLIDVLEVLIIKLKKLQKTEESQREIVLQKLLLSSRSTLSPETQDAEPLSKDFLTALKFARELLDEISTKLIDEFVEGEVELQHFVNNFLFELYTDGISVKIVPLSNHQMEKGSQKLLYTFFSKKQLQILFQYLEYEPFNTFLLISMLWSFIEKGYTTTFHKIQK